MNGCTGCVAVPLRLLPDVWRFLWRAKWLILAVVVLANAAAALGMGAWGPRAQGDLADYTVYAYRQWQSSDIYLQPGDRYEIRARGEWLYSPLVGLHGPAGGLAGMPTYPMNYAPGGALVGRIGEAGEPFYIGAETTGIAMQAGMLYLRINDDILSDNRGKLVVDLDVQRAE